MSTFLQSEVSEAKNSRALARQAISFFLHALLALGVWIGLMLVGYAVQPAGVSRWTILLLSMAVPLVVGLIVARILKDDMAKAVWLLGLIWMICLSLYALDLPTGPGQCMQCDANGKLARTFLSLPSPSGLMDDDGPFLGTWPAAALLGYSIGAWLGLRKRS